MKFIAARKKRLNFTKYKFEKFTKLLIDELKELEKNEKKMKPMSLLKEILVGSQEKLIKSFDMIKNKFS